MIKFLSNTKQVAYASKKVNIKVGDKFNESGFIIAPAQPFWVQEAIDFHKRSNRHYESNIIMNVIELDNDYKVLNIQKFK